MSIFRPSGNVGDDKDRAFCSTTNGDSRRITPCGTIHLAPDSEKKGEMILFQVSPIQHRQHRSQRNRVIKREINLFNTLPIVPGRVKNIRRRLRIIQMRLQRCGELFFISTKGMMYYNLNSAELGIA